MSTSVSLTPDTRIFQLPRAFPLASGRSLVGGQLAFERFGNPDGPVVIVQGGISAGRHVISRHGVPGWWDAVVAPSGAIDLERFCVFGIDLLGGNGASTSPVNQRAEDFPALAPVDQARATSLLLAHLGVTRAHAFVGASYGGMVGLALAAIAPGSLDRLVAIHAPHRPHPRATAWRILQRRLVSLGQAIGADEEALLLARALAMTTYRSEGEFAARFEGRASEPEDRDVWAYLAARGRDFGTRFDARAFVTLSDALDRHDVEPAAIHVPTWIVGSTTDELVPPRQLEDLAGRLSGPSRLTWIESPYGHDAFLKEIDALTPVLHEALERKDPLR